MTGGRYKKYEIAAAEPDADGYSFTPQIQRFRRSQPTAKPTSEKFVLLDYGRFVILQESVLDNLVKFNTYLTMLTVK